MVSSVTAVIRRPSSCTISTARLFQVPVVSMATGTKMWLLASCLYLVSLLEAALSAVLNRSMIRVTWDSYSRCEGTVQNLTKNTRVDSAVRQLGEGGLEQFCLLRCLNVVSDWTARSEDGRVFQTRAAATGNARSPSVERRVDGTTRAGVAADRRWRHVGGPL